MAAVLGLLLTPNVGWLFMCVTTGMYLIYEFMHFCCHVDESWFVRHCPFVNTLRRHHTAHHNARLMMEVNMNLTFPIADWLFGTSDLNRGIIGHLMLNGYDTPYLKKNLRSKPKLPNQAAVLPVGDHWNKSSSRRARLATNIMPNDVKAYVSAAVAIVAIILAYWSGSPVRPEFGNFVLATAAFMILAMWIFPEAGGKKTSAERRQRYDKW
jgi:hypothetical protein